MAGPPPKPWERGALASRPDIPPMTDALPSVNQPPATPAVPDRPSSVYSSSNYGYGSSVFGGYGGYGASGGYGSYSGYGSGAYGYGRPGVPSLYVRAAEQSSRPTFESMESVVHSVGAISMMLESSYSAVYNSFRAVMGVAEQFSLLKGQMARILSGLLAVRWVSWLLRRMLGRHAPAAVTEAAWRQALRSTGQSQPSAWPVLLFFGLVLGAPWLVWQLLRRAAKLGTDWTSGAGEHYQARAEHHFRARNQDELSFSAGQYLRVAPKELQPQLQGWLLASVDGRDSGLVPANHIKILGRRQGTQGLSTEQAGISEATSEQRARITNSDSLERDNLASTDQSKALRRVRFSEESSSAQPASEGRPAEPSDSQPKSCCKSKVPKDLGLE